MRIKILTLFPAMFEGVFRESILKRAIDKGVCSVEIIDMRNYSNDKFHHVDDTPYGGGAGMVLACDVIDRAIQENASSTAYKVLLTPQGKTYQDSLARELASKEELVLICGHYEGFDERVRFFVDDEISIGDFVLTGGELAASVVCDSVIRLLDQAIKKESHEEDSFAGGLLEYPQYTRPVEYKNLRVPDVLLQGNHQKISEFRKKESLRKTYLKRRDLLEQYSFSLKEEKMMQEIYEEEGNTILNQMVNKAKALIYQTARPLTLALFQYFFESGTKEAVLRILSYYQNKDGGFGHSLELDCMNPYSSPIQTVEAIKIIKMLQFDHPQHPMIKGIIRYLSSGKGYDQNQHQWAFTIPTNNDFPHAIWWQHYDQQNLYYNPSAYLMAFIIEFGNPISKIYEKVLSMIPEALNFLIQNKIDWNTADAYAVLEGYSYLYQMMEKKELFSDLLNQMKECILEGLAYVLSKNKDHTYGCSPSMIFRLDCQLGIEENVDIIKQEILDLPSKQLDDGSFGIDWQWHRDEMEFSRARAYWLPHITFEKLLFYKKFEK